MKKRFLCSLLLAISVLVCMAQTTQKHTVQRGETMESIAQKYGVTVSAMKEANPNIGEYFYVGMVLNVPERVMPVEHVDSPKTDEQYAETSVVAPTEKESQEVTDNESAMSNPVVSVGTKDNGEERLRMGNYFGSSFTSRSFSKGTKNMNGLCFLWGYNNFIRDNVFMNVSLEFAMTSHSKNKVENKLYSLRAPISINYFIPFGKSGGFSVGGGIFTDVAVVGKSEYEESKNKKITTKYSDIDGYHSLIMGLHLRSMVMFTHHWGLFGSYNLGLMNRFKDTKENAWTVGVVFGF